MYSGALADGSSFWSSDLILFEISGDINSAIEGKRWLAGII